MRNHVEFGAAVGRHMFRKTAAGGAKGMAGAAGSVGNMIGGWLGRGAAKAAPAAPTAPKITISPAEAAAGRAKTVITPQQAAAAQPLPKSPGLVTPSPQGRAGTAAPDWVRNNQALSRGVDPSTGVRPGAVAPAPPAPIAPPRQTPRDNQASRGFDLLRAGGLRPIQ
jgi:hypothetical protein